MNPDIQDIITKARRSLEAADVLRARDDQDFAASRAYYAMFYVAEALLWTLGQSYSSHSATIGAYGKEFAKTARLDPKFHRWLIESQNWRTAGDYDARAVITAEKAEELCRWAEEFIEAAGLYLDSRSA